MAWHEHNAPQRSALIRLERVTDCETNVPGSEALPGCIPATLKNMLVV